MIASDIMTRSVVTATPETSVEQAAGLMSEHHVSALPVLDDDGKIVGIVSEGDLMRRVQGAKDAPRSWWLSIFSDAQFSARDFARDRGRYLKDIMSRKVITIAPDTPVGKIARLLEKERIKRVPVVADDTLIGIVSRANLLQALAAQPVVKVSASADDEEKRDIVLGALAQIPGLSPVHLNVVVGENRIDVWGVVGSDDEAEAARVALEAIEGVGEISVHLGRIPNYAWGI